MSPAPHVLELHDCDYEANKAVFRVETPHGERFDTLQAGRVTYQSQTEWLWPGHVPLGKVTVIEGGPGSGKSSVAFDLAARVGKRQPWPDGTPSILPVADVLVVSRHNEAERTLSSFNPKEAGARSLYWFRGFATETPDLDRTGQRPVSLPGDLEALDVYLEFHHTIGVVIIDPLSDFCDTPKLFAETLHQLNALAERFRIAIIVTVPANCRTDTQGRLKVTSRWPTEAARCAWSLLADPDDATRRLFVAKRTNFCREPEGLAFRIDEKGVAWEAASAISPLDPLGQLNACEMLLQELLSAGPLPSATMFRLGAEQGFTPRGLRAAAKRLGVTSGRIGFGGDGHWHWRLPGADPADIAALARETLNRTLFVDGGLPSVCESPENGGATNGADRQGIDAAAEPVAGSASAGVRERSLTLPPHPGPRPQQGDGESFSTATPRDVPTTKAATGNARLKEKQQPGWDDGNRLPELGGVGCSESNSRETDH